MNNNENKKPKKPGVVKNLLLAVLIGILLFVGIGLFALHQLNQEVKNECTKTGVCVGF